MRVVNLHERFLPIGLHDAVVLLNSLGSDQDLLWPHEHWPRIRFHPRLTAGAVGRHGPVAYRVSTLSHRLIRFTFEAPVGFDGYHELSLEEDPGSCRLRHLISMRLRGRALLTWPLLYRPLHDALIEDLLDKAERHATCTSPRPPRWSPCVRFLRFLMSARRREGP